MIKYDVEGLEQKKKEIQDLKDNMEELRLGIKALWDNLESERTPSFLNKIDDLLYDDLESFGERAEDGVNALKDIVHSIRETTIGLDNNLVK